MNNVYKKIIFIFLIVSCFYQAQASDFTKSPTGQDRDTVLHLACKNNDLNQVRKLLKDPQTNISIINGEGKTALNIAREMLKLAEIKPLHKPTKEDINLRRELRRTAESIEKLLTAATRKNGKKSFLPLIANPLLPKPQR